jgi:hypothetical protein
MRLGEITYKDADLKDPRRLRAEKFTRQGVTCSAAQDYLTVHLPRSKTDYNNQGTDILVAAAGDTACPVHHMLALMQQDPQEAGQTLFRLHNGAFTRNRVLRLLSSRLTHCRNQCCSLQRSQLLKRGGQRGVQTTPLPRTDSGPW